jgi:hypothetical protein
MVIGKLKYLIEPVRGQTSHRLDAVPMGLMVSARVAMTWHHPWFVDLLYSRTVALIHETGIKGKSCTCDSGSNHMTHVSIYLARLRNSIRIVRFSQ